MFSSCFVALRNSSQKRSRGWWWRMQMRSETLSFWNVDMSQTVMWSTGILSSQVLYEPKHGVCIKEESHKCCNVRSQICGNTSIKADLCKIRICQVPDFYHPYKTQWWSADRRQILAWEKIIESSLLSHPFLKQRHRRSEVRKWNVLSVKSKAMSLHDLHLWFIVCFWLVTVPLRLCKVSLGALKGCFWPFE